MFRNDCQTAAEIHRSLRHPVIDVDAHVVEYMPALLDHLRETVGRRAVDLFYGRTRSGYPTLVRQPRTPWWVAPTRNTIDHMSCVLPALLAERLPELGIDLAVVYPSLRLTDIPDPDLRQGVCRAYNEYNADLLRPHLDRLIPAAAIPMTTPTEAVEELRHASHLGFKVAMLAGHVVRPRAAVDRRHQDPRDLAHWVDNLALDSLYDYDPVWQACSDLKIAPTFHSGSMGWGTRNVPSNFMFNHIGSFAAAHEAICKALVLGGVTRRFPNLSFLFLEGGVAWALALLTDLVSHWEKRSAGRILEYDPDNLDLAVVHDLFERYGDGIGNRRSTPGLAVLQRLRAGGHPECLDDFAAAGIASVEDFAARFGDRFYFGCEADDPLAALAFDGRLTPPGCAIHAVFSSDIGHWDAPHLAGVIPEAYELVTTGVLSEDEFERFAWSTPAKFLTSANDDFFDGSVVADSARQWRNTLGHGSRQMTSAPPRLGDGKDGPHPSGAQYPGIRILACSSEEICNDP